VSDARHTAHSGDGPREAGEVSDIPRDDDARRVPDPIAGLDGPPPSLADPAITRAARLCLATTSDPAWPEVAIARLDETMLDHAWCEKKAAATGMAMVSRYPEDPELVRQMIDLAREEWEHFERVHRLLVARGIPFAREQRDPYVNALIDHCRPNEPERYLDRMLVAAFVEARSCERFALLAKGIGERDPELAAFYGELFVSEARHYTTFVELAYKRVPREVVRARLAEFSRFEAELIRRLPVAPRMH
jgi:tRNA-(ms[2]io[6]A)-hydroxylase